MTASTVHQAAAEGFTKQADTYARGRPEYPEALQDWLSGALALAPGKTVVDVGAGTGKFSRLLGNAGASVIAVEPVAAMRAQMAHALPQVTVLEGTAEAMPLADASVDAVVCAQAFHWFANQDAMREIKRVLRPGGWLGLVWNVRDESVDWVARLTEIMTPHEGDAPRFHKGDWRKLFPVPGFGELALTAFDYTHEGPPQQVIIDRVMSVSFIASLSADAQRIVRGQLHAVIDTHPALSGQAHIAFPYRTEAYCCQRLG